MVAILNLRSANDSQFSTGSPIDHSCKFTIQLAWWFLTRRFLKFQPMKTHYGPWQPCWISNQHQKHKSGRGPSNEHFWQVWFNSVQWFQRRRFKCEKLTDWRWTLTHDKSSHGLWPGELKNRPIRNKNCLWWPCLLMDWDKMSNLYRGPSIQFEQQTRDLTVTAIDFKITRSGGDNSKKFPGAAL